MPKERIWSAHEAMMAQAVPAPIKIVMDWICSYIIKPHPDLGRTGDVCPFVGPALRLKKLWLAAVYGIPPSHETMCNLVEEYMKAYQSLGSDSSAAKDLSALILIFPDIAGQHACSLVGGIQKIMKPIFVEAGLMLGEFYGRSESPGLHNSHFRPLRSPLSLLVYRKMVPSDLVFLTNITDPPELRIRFIVAYLRLLHDTLSTDDLRTAETERRKAESEINLRRYV